MYINEEDVMASLKYYSTKKSEYGHLESHRTVANHGLSISELCKRVNSKTFYFHKVKMHSIPKFRGGDRLVFSMHIDDYLVQNVCICKFELEHPGIFSDAVYAFRRNFGPSQLARDMHLALKESGMKYLLRMDIRHFVDSVDLCLLTSYIEKYVDDPEFNVLLKRYISHNRLNKNDRHCFGENCGLFIGGPFTGFLINLYLIEFDRFVSTLDIAYYFRYGDDIFVLADQRNVLENAYSQFSQYLKSKLGLIAHELTENGKSSIRSLLDDGHFFFYDYCFDNTELLLRETTLGHILSDITGLIETADTIEQAICSINYYFTKRHTHDNSRPDYESGCYFLCLSICTRVKQFSYLDNRINRLILRKFGYSKDNRNSMMKLVRLKTLYYYVKKQQRKYEND